MDQPHIMTARKKIAQAIDRLLATRQFLEKQSTEWKTVLKIEAELHHLFKTLEAKEQIGFTPSCSSWSSGEL